MKINKILMIAAILLSSLCTFARDKQVMVTVSEPDAIIYANGQEVGLGSATVVVLKYTQLTVQVKKIGFLTQEHIFYNGVGHQPEPPKNYHFNLQKDDAYEASTKNDKANVDFSIAVNEKLNTTDAWKLTTQIVTDYFDAIEVSDKETSYLRTAWSIQTFQQNTIRTRLIIKLGSSNPLTFKIKLVSEASGSTGTSVKADEQFKEWDRVLRKYESIISDFSTRLGNI
jgi:hypothetical protein